MSEQQSQAGHCILRAHQSKSCVNIFYQNLYEDKQQRNDNANTIFRRNDPCAPQQVNNTSIVHREFKFGTPGTQGPGELKIALRTTSTTLDPFADAKEHKRELG